jgi:hypothetical protein
MSFILTLSASRRTLNPGGTSQHESGGSWAEVASDPRDLRALQAIADDMERPLAWVARRGIRLYISQIIEAEETLARGDHIVEEMGREAREPRKAGKQEDGR